MNSTEYNKRAAETDVSTKTLEYYMKGLVEELGEVFGHFKRIERDDNNEITAERLELIVKEMGDFNWYLVRFWNKFCERASIQFVPFEEIWKQNIEKLADRKERGVLHGSGSSR